MNRGLIVFARKPVAGLVKTRIARDMGTRAATELYAAMLEDVLERSADLDGVRTLVFWALEAGEPPDYPALPCLEMLKQCGSTLGERMANAFDTAFSSGIESCCIIGSDSPDLPRQHIQQAFRMLERDRTDIVIGPAVDGGYYLLGMKHLWGRLFEDIPWSSAQVLKASCERASELGLKTTLLPGWYDIDTLDDLRKLANTADMEAPRTRRAIRLLTTISPLPQQAGAP